MMLQDYDAAGKMCGVAASAIILQKKIHQSLFNFLARYEDKKILQHSTFELKESYPDYKLTRRESEVLFFLIRGRTLREIGANLFISTCTVESHLQSLKSKLDCKTKSDVIEKVISSNFNFILLWQMLKTN